MTKKSVVTSLITDIKKEQSLLVEVYTVAFDHWCHLGDLLTQLKENVKHGEFTQTVNEKLPFAQNQAAKYMKVYANETALRELAKQSPEDCFDNLTDTAKAVKALPAPAKKAPSTKAKKAAAKKAKKKVPVKLKAVPKQKAPDDDDDDDDAPIISLDAALKAEILDQMLICTSVVDLCDLNKLALSRLKEITKDSPTFQFDF